MSDTFYITSPIYYVNDKPHIGHAYTGLACDVVARYWRLRGRQVHFLTGTDEHGQKVENSASKQGESPQTFTDRLSEEFKKLAEAMNLSNDDFIRTTDERHKKGAQVLWERLLEKEAIYLGDYEGWYAVRDEAFYGEDELTKNADGKLVSPYGAEVEWVSEPSYFFNLSKWQDRLLQHYDAHPDFIAPESRRNEVISFVKGGLKDLSISRTSFSWGVQVPNDEKHIMYVWLDALANYITALGYGSGDEGDYQKFWPADLHIVGKDILRFHAVYWPAFLMAAELPLPKRVFAHGWWTNNGEKISKSLGNVIDPYDLIKKYGLDQVRYFLLREIPFGNDGDFNHDAIVRRINADLANDLGNLCQRVLSFTYKNCHGKIPTFDAPPKDDKVEAHIKNMQDSVNQHMESQKISEALQSIWEAIGHVNVYVNDAAPWNLKENPAAMNEVLYVALRAIYDIAVILQPFMPESAAKIIKQLGIKESVIGFDAAGDYQIELMGNKIPEPQGIFPRMQQEKESC